MARQRHLFRGSTRIRQGWYDDERDLVDLEFVDGARVRYRRVPLEVWQDLCAARSPGHFVRSRLEGYSYHRI